MLMEVPSEKWAEVSGREETLNVELPTSNFQRRREEIASGGRR